MNLPRIYRELIQKRRLETPSGYTENHHIVPKSMGGSNQKDNLVRLTAREHYVAHKLLYKIHKNNVMALAWHLISKTKVCKDVVRISSREYSCIKKINQKALKERVVKPMSDSTKEKLRLANTGKVLSVAHKAKISKSSLGKRLSDSTKEKMSISKTKKVQCIETSEIFNSGKEAELYYGLANSSISKVCRGIYKQTKGLTWKYL